MRSVIQIAGESGTGIESSGAIIMKSLKKLGYNIIADREFPSLIKGGSANIQINFSSNKIRALSQVIDVSVAIDREGILTALKRLKPGGTLIHAMDRLSKAVKDFDKQVSEKNIKVIHVPARQIAIDSGGSVLMVNVVLLGALWKTFGFEISTLYKEVESQFGSKPQLLTINLACLQSGYDTSSVDLEISELQKNHVTDPDFNQKHMLLDGNTAIGIGAIHAGMRAYFAYPMSPASSILSYLAKVAEKTGIVVKQVEDEITAAQMVLGAMHTGTRSMTATSGGGFDLMTETVSLSGIIETPLVIVIAQRPGPGTGLPTWTGQADLQLAIRSGHGEYARSVISVSDATSAFEEIQHAFNIAELFQIPTIVLTEKHVADKFETTQIFEQNTIGVKRGLAKSDDDSLIQIKEEEGTFVDANGVEILSPSSQSDRFRITENGVSTRWIPGSNKIQYFANGDEHHEDGTLNESETAGEMIQKRIRKLKAIADFYPEPVLYGPENADVTLVGWGSTKSAVLDAMDELKSKNLSVNYLHYTYLYPLKTDLLSKLAKSTKKLCLIEQNATGQLGQLIAEETNILFANKLLKWNGRPLYVEEVAEWILNQAQI